MSLQAQLLGELDSLYAVLGSAYIGTVFASILYGFNTMQAFLYFRHSSADSNVLRSLIAFLFVLDTLHLALIVNVVYTYTIIGLASPEVLIRPVWSITAHFIVSSLSDAIVRSLYCWRIWIFSNKNRFMAISIILSTVAASASGWAFSVWGFLTQNYFFEITTVSYFLYSGLGASVVADALIAACMCYLLARSRTGFANLDSVIHVLMLYSINTGLLTSLGAVAALLLYVLYPTADLHKLTFIGIYFVLPKRKPPPFTIDCAARDGLAWHTVLLTSLLASLNARSYLKERAQPSVLFTTMPALSTRSKLTRSSRGWWSQTTRGSMPAPARPFASPLASTAPVGPITMTINQLMEEEELRAPKS
ncbi:uncharacterized protein FIBRA_04795 [Fibroporia radiculosa]|uniref:DUF6534 domain-containing protein n=1 Tax=Fibroporia radiculosa TaxID=599839 RepID=J4H356_9APHY|nr:uncharacterized protein FIBRA_04795 [Fibroporia radiculosa]CCM02689.1 predicted protein [Fibroporia radiculosa]